MIIYTGSRTRPLSSSDIPLEEIADLCGHSGTTVTEKVYRHQLHPILLSGAVVMDQIFAEPDEQALTDSEEAVDRPDDRGKSDRER